MAKVKLGILTRLEQRTRLLPGDGISFGFLNSEEHDGQGEVQLFRQSQNPLEFSQLQLSLDRKTAPLKLYCRPDDFEAVAWELARAFGLKLGEPETSNRLSFRFIKK